MRPHPADLREAAYSLLPLRQTTPFWGSPWGRTPISCLLYLGARSKDRAPLALRCPQSRASKTRQTRRRRKRITLTGGSKDFLVRMTLTLMILTQLSFRPFVNDVYRLARSAGFEPTTFLVAPGCSTIELTPRCLDGHEWIRTTICLHAMQLFFH